MPQPIPTQTAVARCYGLTRQRIQQMVSLDGIPLETFLEPDSLLSYLLANVRRSALRCRLLSAENRAAIRQKLSKISNP